MSKQPVQPPNFTETELKDFMSVRRTLIVTPQQATGSLLRKSILGYGGRSEQVISVDNVAEARKLLEKHPTHLLITDLRVGDDTGLQLLPMQEAGFTNRAEVATMALSDDPSANVSALMIESLRAWLARASESASAMESALARVVRAGIATSPVDSFRIGMRVVERARVVSRRVVSTCA